MDLVTAYLPALTKTEFAVAAVALTIAIGKPLKLSPAFPPLHTVRAAFTAYGVPLLAITFKSKSVYLFDKLFQFKQFPRIQQVYEDC